MVAADTQFEIQSDASSNQPPVVLIRGDVDLSCADQLWRLVHDAMGRSRHVILDMSETTFVDSMALNVIVRAYQQGASTETTVVVRAPSPFVVRILALTGLDELVTIEAGPSNGEHHESPGVHDPASAVEALYRELLTRWNQRDATGYAALFASDGTVVGFDGREATGTTAIAEYLASTFTDHGTGTYVGQVRETRALGDSGSMLLRATAGLVPPGAADVEPTLDAVQVVVAVETEARWQVAHFQNTPATFPPA